MPGIDTDVLDVSKFRGSGLNFIDSDVAGDAFRRAQEAALKQQLAQEHITAAQRENSEAGQTWDARRRGIEAGTRLKEQEVGKGDAEAPFWGPTAENNFRKQQLSTADLTSQVVNRIANGDEETGKKIAATYKLQVPEQLWQDRSLARAMENGKNHAEKMWPGDSARQDEWYQKTWLPFIASERKAARPIDDPTLPVRVPAPASIPSVQLNEDEEGGLPPEARFAQAQGVTRNEELLKQFTNPAPAAPKNEQFLSQLSPRQAALVKGVSEGRIHSRELSPKERTQVLADVAQYDSSYGRQQRGSQYANLIKAIADYDYDPNKLPSYDRQRIIEDVLEYDPNYSAANYPARAAAIKSFITPTGTVASPAAAIVAGNTAIQHLGQLARLSEKIGGTNNGWILNKPLNWLYANYNDFKNDPDVSRYIAMLGRYSEEATKFYRGASGAEADVKRTIDLLTVSGKSPEARAAAIGQEAHAMESKVNAQQDSWKTALGGVRGWDAALRRANIEDFPIIHNKSAEELRYIDELDRRRGTPARSPNPIQQRMSPQAKSDQPATQQQTATQPAAPAQAPQQRAERPPLPPNLANLPSDQIGWSPSARQFILRDGRAFDEGGREVQRYASGGSVGRYANGGKVPYYAGGGAVGPVEGPGDGREDNVRAELPPGAYVLPADYVSALGQGNTDAGQRKVDEMFGPAETASGGGGRPSQVSDGERILSPGQVARAGGSAALDEEVKRTRAGYISHLSALPGPKHSGAFFDDGGDDDNGNDDDNDANDTGFEDTGESSHDGIDAEGNVADANNDGINDVTGDMISGYDPEAFDPSAFGSWATENLTDPNTAYGQASPEELAAATAASNSQAEPGGLAGFFTDQPAKEDQQQQDPAAPPSTTEGAVALPEVNVEVGPSVGQSSTGPGHNSGSGPGGQSPSDYFANDPFSPSEIDPGDLGGVASMLNPGGATSPLSVPQITARGPSGVGAAPGYNPNLERVSPELKARFDAMWNAAPESAKAGAGVISGFRTQAQQQQAWNNYITGRGGLAARPGNSQHQFGRAVDFKDPTGWFHQNASKYGVTFPLVARNDYPHAQIDPNFRGTLPSSTALSTKDSSVQFPGMFPNVAFKDNPAANPGRDLSTVDLPQATLTNNFGVIGRGPANPNLLNVISNTYNNSPYSPSRSGGQPDTPFDVAHDPTGLSPTTTPTGPAFPQTKTVEQMLKGFEQNPLTPARSGFETQAPGVGPQGPGVGTTVALPTITATTSPATAYQPENQFDNLSQMVTNNQDIHGLPTQFDTDNGGGYKPRSRFDMLSQMVEQGNDISGLPTTDGASTIPAGHSTQVEPMGPPARLDQPQSQYDRLSQMVTSGQDITGLPTQMLANGGAIAQKRSGLRSFGNSYADGGGDGDEEFQNIAASQRAPAAKRNLPRFETWQWKGRLRDLQSRDDLDRNPHLRGIQDLAERGDIYHQFPPTIAQFMKWHGREPTATDAELEFYYGDPGGRLRDLSEEEMIDNAIASPRKRSEQPAMFPPDIGDFIKKYGRPPRYSDEIEFYNPAPEDDQKFASGGIVGRAPYRSSGLRRV